MHTNRTRVLDYPSLRGEPSASFVYKFYFGNNYWHKASSFLDSDVNKWGMCIYALFKCPIILFLTDFGGPWFSIVNDAFRAVRGFRWVHTTYVLTPQPHPQTSPPPKTHDQRPKFKSALTWLSQVSSFFSSPPNLRQHHDHPWVWFLDRPSNAKPPSLVPSCGSFASPKRCILNKFIIFY